MSTEISGVAIVNATADNTVIGGTTPVNGTFATVLATNVSSNTISASTSATVPTVTSGDNSGAVATTAWAKFGFSLLASLNGYIKFPAWLGGLILQWGSANGASSTIAISFNTSFTNCWVVQALPLNYGPNAGRATPYLNTPPGTTSFSLSSAGSTNSVFWFAVGN